MTRGARLLAASLLAAGLASGAPARAAFEPDHAQADVDAAMREHDYPFCREPYEPLSPDARELCDHASAIPRCGGFAAACARAAPPSPSPPPWWALWLHVPAWLGALAQILVWLVVAALVGLVLVPILRGLLRLGSTPREAPREALRSLVEAAAPPPEEVATGDEEQLLTRAQELAARGELRASLQLYLAASLRALDKRGALRVARDRTNGEYVRACADEVARPALREIVREVDRVQFGGQDPTADAVSRAGGRAVAIVRAAPVALLLLAMLGGSLGCGGISLARSRRAGDDPAGGELALELLRRQGAVVMGLGSSLASLPLPSEGERAPAVVVDVETTSLDDDTREHLEAWVKAGGSLVLLGAPTSWPKELGASYVFAARPYRLTARRLLARAIPAGPDEPQTGDDDEESAIYARGSEHGELVAGNGLAVPPEGETVARFDDGTPYAFMLPHGRGFVLGVGSDELLTNAGIARPGNAAALVALLSNADRTELRFAGAEDGVSPPSSPISALLRAGLGLAVAHGAVFALLLFVSAGTRLTRPRPSAPVRRRAFSEHVEAVGALYARARAAPHALGAFARFADERLRARMPRGSADVATFLASRAKMPVDVCQRLWARAMKARLDGAVLGDELTVLRELCALYAAAMAQDK